MAGSPVHLAARLVRYLHPRFPYVILGTLMVEFLLAFMMMFIFPPGSLLMVFVGLITLGLAIALHAGLGALDEAMNGERVG